MASNMSTQFGYILLITCGDVIEALGDDHRSQLPNSHLTDDIQKRIDIYL